MHPYTYLALGDSYTMGVAVPTTSNFPYQTVQALRKRHHLFQAPEIIAGHGWSTTELINAIEQTRLLRTYHFVSLLIGANNQTTGRSVEEFSLQMEALLLRAIQLAGNISENVFVLSIPDWASTPFALTRDTHLVPKTIDAFNQSTSQLCKQYEINFVDVTTSLRNNKSDTELFAIDQLHLTGKAYMPWSEQLSILMDARLLEDKKGHTV